MAFAPLLLPALGGFLTSAGGIAAVATAGIGAVTAISQGNYQAAVARNNADAATAQGNRESAAAQANAMRLSQENAGRVGALTASQSASGLDVGSRSFGQARALETRIGNIEVRDTARAGADAANANFREASNFRAEASNAKRQGLLGAAGSVIGLAGSFAGSSQGKSLIGGSKLKKRFG